MLFNNEVQPATVDCRPQPDSHGSASIATQQKPAPFSGLVPGFLDDKNSVDTKYTRTLFLCGLNDNIDENYLAAHFASHGKIIRLRVFAHSRTGQHLRSAIIKFDTPAAATFAHNAANQKLLMGSMVSAKLERDGEFSSQYVCQVEKDLDDGHTFSIKDNLIYKNPSMLIPAAPSSAALLPAGIEKIPSVEEKELLSPDKISSDPFDFPAGNHPPYDDQIGPSLTTTSPLNIRDPYPILINTFYHYGVRRLFLLPGGNWQIDFYTVAGMEDALYTINNTWIMGNYIGLKYTHFDKQDALARPIGSDHLISKPSVPNNTTSSILNPQIHQLTTSAPEGSRPRPSSTITSAIKPRLNLPVDPPLTSPSVRSSRNPHEPLLTTEEREREERLVRANREIEELEMSTIPLAFKMIMLEVVSSIVDEVERKYILKPSMDEFNKWYASSLSHLQHKEKILACKKTAHYTSSLLDEDPLGTKRSIASHIIIKKNNFAKPNKLLFDLKSDDSDHEADVDKIRIKRLRKNRRGESVSINANDKPQKKLALNFSKTARPKSSKLSKHNEYVSDSSLESSFSSSSSSREEEEESDGHDLAAIEAINGQLDITLNPALSAHPTQSRPQEETDLSVKVLSSEDLVSKSKKKQQAKKMSGLKQASKKLQPAADGLDIDTASLPDDISEPHPLSGTTAPAFISPEEEFGLPADFLLTAKDAQEIIAGISVLLQRMFERIRSLYPNADLNPSEYLNKIIATDIPHPPINNDPSKKLLLFYQSFQPAFYTLLERALMTLPPRSGSARTAGVYKLTHEEKMKYVTSKAKLSAPSFTAIDEKENQKMKDFQRRMVRATARQLFQQAPLSDLQALNSLQTRKKQLKFGISPIHDVGLFALEKIAGGDMVIEYVGEVIPIELADQREIEYTKEGIGSSYLFRVDDKEVIDATKKGNVARFINHSCDPNCIAKVLTVGGESHIVIYAKKNISLGEEITYDYKFPFEEEDKKIPCCCGAILCRKYLNYIDP